MKGLNRMIKEQIVAGYSSWKKFKDYTNRLQQLCNKQINNTYRRKLN